MNEHQQFIIALFCGTFFGGIFYLYFSNIFVSSLVAGIAMSLFMAILLYMFPNEDKKFYDERTETLAHKSLAQAWTAGLISIPLIFWIDFLGWMQFSIIGTLFLIWMILILSAAIFSFLNQE